MSGAPIVYEWTAVGLDAVEAAFKRADKLAEQSATKTARAAAAGGKARASAAEAAAAKEIAATAKAAAAQQKALDKQLSAASKAADKAKALADKTAAAVVAAEERANEKLIRGLERREAQMSAIVQREQRRREITTAREKRERNERILGGVEKGLGKVGDVAMTGGALAAGTIGAAAREVMRLQELSNRISVNARQAGETAISPEELRKEFEQTARETPGVKSTDVAEAVMEFITKTGDVKTARAMAGTFATTAQASGAGMTEISSTAAVLSQKFGIKDPAGMQQAMATLLEQGKKGAFELRDAAQYMSEMGASAQRFGIGKGAAGIATLGGLTQLARTSSGSGAEAATAVERMFGNILEHAGKLQSGKFGSRIKVFDKEGNTRDIQTLLGEIIAGVGKNNMGLKKTQLQELFGERGIKTVSPLIEAYTEAFQKAKGEKDDKGRTKTDKEAREAGIAALNAKYREAVDVQTSWNEVQQDAKQIQQDASAQLEAAWESLKSTVGEQVVPKLLEMVPSLVKLSAGIGPVVDAAAELAGAFADLVAFLKDAGLIKEKPKPQMTHAEKAAAAQKDYDQLLGKIQGKGEATNDEARQLTALKETVKKEELLDALYGKQEQLEKDFTKDKIDREGRARGKMVGTMGAVGGALGSLVGQTVGGAALGAGLGGKIFDAENWAAKGIMGDKLQDELDAMRATRQQQEQQSLENINAAPTTEELAAAKASIEASEREAQAKQEAADAAERLASSLDAAAGAADRSKPISDRN